MSDQSKHDRAATALGAMNDALADVLSQERAAGFAEAIEMAAKVADDYLADCLRAGPTLDVSGTDAAGDIASAIRALAPTKEEP